ncbi:MAG: hypothetical protein NT074_00105 [Methanomicrobiales archaeon]|nr:hypothetical protein [Methanomicrobiales archaeon]
MISSPRKPKSSTVPGEFWGIYVTLNPVNSVLLSRRANRVETRIGKNDSLTADTDIVTRCWLPIDIDPVRPSGVSSSDQEHEAAIEKAGRIGAFLAEKGFPAPLIADSGNGAHVLYRIDLPNDDASRDLVKRCLEVLAVVFSDGVCTVDTSNHNAARIWKLYGTVSRKGDHVDERPHRRSRVIEPGAQMVVSREMLEDLANCVPSNAPPIVPEQKSNTFEFRIDLREWLTRYGIGFSGEKPHQGGTIYPLDECPFSMAHKDGAYAIQFGNGAIFAGCHHNSCGGGQQRWQELREKYEPELAGKRKGREEKFREWERERAHARVTRDGLQDVLPPSSTRNDASSWEVPALSGDTRSRRASSKSNDFPGREEALTILQSGDPIKGMLESFARDHVGDEVVAECLILSLASRSVVNTKGLHVSVSGESGKGKSYAFYSMLRQVPRRFRLSGRMSNKALFYIEDLCPGTVIVLDDTTLSEEMSEILKGVTTSFREPFEYRTVNRDRKGQVCTIPERCVWWVAKVEGTGDDQVFNRMLTCWIDDSPEQDARVLARVLARDAVLPESDIEEREDTFICRAMWEILGDQRIYVAIPFAEQIRFLAVANRRNPEMVLDLIKAHAVLMFMQRETSTVGGITCINATRDDFDRAARLYGLLNGTAGGQTTKLTKREADILSVIEHHTWSEFTLPMLQRLTGIPHASLHRAFHGYTSRGTTYSGLLEKCPAVSHCDRTIQIDEQGGSTSRRALAYSYDHKLALAWMRGGAVWVDVGNSPTLQQHFSTNPADAGQLNSEATCSDPNNINNNNLLYNENDEQSSNYDHIAGDDSKAHYDDLSFYDLPDAGQYRSKTIKSHSIEKQESIGAQNLSSTCWISGEEQITTSADHAANEKIRVVTAPQHFSKPFIDAGQRLRPSFNPHDFKKLDFPDPHPCSKCGRKKDSWYIENLTPRRKKQPSLDPWYLCQKCYQHAVKRHQESCVPLPGTISLAALEPVRTEHGRCTICNLVRATWIDRSRHLKVCDQCYQREQERSTSAGASEEV